MKENLAQYFENKSEDEPRQLEWPEALTHPIIPDVKYQDAGRSRFRDSKKWTVEGGTEKLKLSFSYGPSRTEEVLDHLSELERGNPGRKHAFQETYGTWRMLEGLALTDSEGNRLDLTPILKKQENEEEQPYSFGARRPRRDISVLFMAADTIPKDAKFWGTANPDGRAAIVSGVTTPRGIITLLHELAHVEREREPREADRLARYHRYASTLNRKLLTEEERNEPDIHGHIAGYILEEERSAWASTLRRLRPFIFSGALDKEAVLSVIHTIALKSYSEQLNRIVDPSFIESLYQKLVSAFNTLLSPKMAHDKPTSIENAP